MHVGSSHGRRTLSATRSPGASVRTPEPTSTTSPSASWPSTSRSLPRGGVPYWNELISRSVPQIPTSRIRTVTSRSPRRAGGGTSMTRISRRSGNTASARMGCPTSLLNLYTLERSASPAAPNVPRPRGRTHDSSMPAYIENYGLIGDATTVALISQHGSIDWLCLPRIDSDACFAKLLGSDQHGYWAIRPATAVRSIERHYRRDTLVLESVIATDKGRARVIDFMPPGQTDHDIIRIVE